MQRIFDYSPAAEGTIVPRILITVHRAIDVNFPKASAAPRQFTKTVFGEGGESTAVVMAPKDTGDSKVQVPPPPLGSRGGKPKARDERSSGPSGFSKLDPIGSGLEQFSQKSMVPMTQDEAPITVKSRKLRMFLLFILLALVGVYAYLQWSKMQGN